MTRGLEECRWSQLFSAGMVGGTALLSVSYFVTFMILVTSGAWRPTLLQRAGIKCAQLSVAIALFALGSVFGTPLGGFLVSRFAARRVLPAALVGGAATLVSHVIQSIAFAIVCLGFAGFFLGVASSGLIALTPLLYPTAIFAPRALVGPRGSADSVLLSDRSPAVCLSTGVCRSAIALPHSKWPRCARPCSARRKCLAQIAYLLGTAPKKKRIQPPCAECSQDGCEPPSASARLPTFFKSLSSS
jgi:hypothetical protein